MLVGVGIFVGMFVGNLGVTGSLIKVSQ